MKKYTTAVLLAAISFGCFAQNNRMLVRHDTILLRADECKWIIKSLVKNDPSLKTTIGKSVPLVILQAIEKGSLKATDPETEKPIPGKEIFIWKMPVDSVAQVDNEGNFTKIIAVKRQLNSSSITQIRIIQDWYLEISTGKLQSSIKWIELLEEIHSSEGVFIGYRPVCKIYY